MNKKTFAIIIVFVLIMLAGFGIFYFFFFHNTGASTTTSQNPSFGTGTNPETGTLSPTTNNNNQTGSGNGTINSASLPKLRHISTIPIAGAVAFDISTTTSTSTSTGIKKQTQLETMIEYIESATGHVDETRTDTLETDQISLTTIPKIYQAFWTRTGNAVYMQYLDGDTENIQTYYGQLAKNPSAVLNSTSTVVYAPQEIQGTFLPQNIGALAVSEDKDQLFYLLENNAGSQVVVSAPNGSQSKVLLDSPLKEWNMNWVNDSTLALTTKASAAAGGYLYFLNTSSGRLDRVLGDLPGLTTLSNPAGTEIFFTEGQNNTVTGGLYSPQTGAITPFAAATLPEKCVWSKKTTNIIYCAVPTSMPLASYPDAWYQGLVSFNDNFWGINTVTGTSTLLANPSVLANTQIDGTHLFLDPRENYLFFTNKKDGTLWSIGLNQ